MIRSRPALGRPAETPRRAYARPGLHPDTGLLLQGTQQLPAGLLAAPASLGADPAVRVVRGMPLALVAAALADGHAGLQQRPGDAGVVLRQTADDADGGGADIGAVQAQP